MTREYFLKKAKELYGDLYTYEKVREIKSNKDTVIITCPKHGDFKRIINNFFNGRGCSLCNKEKRTEENKKKVIEKCNKVHNYKYDYSKVYFEKQKKDVTIICPIHGEFKQSLDAHSRGEECPKCAMIKQSRRFSKPTELFIKEARVIHGDKYIYLKTDLYNRDEKGRVIITCPKHGDFLQNPNSHLQGQGCPKCVGKGKTTEDFINEMKEKFGDIYDFSETEYNGTHTNVTVIYNGKRITASPSNLLRSKKPVTYERIYINEDFIKKSRIVHGNKYDYFKTDLKHRDEKGRVCIICPNHGEFWQTPHDHLDGCGCKLCKLSKLEERVIYFLKEKNIDFIHIYYPDWLSKGLSHQSIDIYLPKYNVGIECQGIQHFKDNKWFKESLDNVINRDIKKNYKAKDKLTLLYLIDKHISKKDIINNEKYCNIYNNDNTFKEIETLFENVKKLS